MKTVGIYFPAMRMGGAEKVGLEFIKDLKKYYKVTVILNKKEGALLEYLPKDIEITLDYISDFNSLVKNDLKKLKIFSLFRDLLYYINVKLNIKKEKTYSYIIKRKVNNKLKFDVAIGYVANVSTQIFALKHRIKAEKKIAWVHGETTELKDTKLFNKYYSCFDKIYCVSKVSREHFVNRFPNLENKTDVYYNRIDSETILEKAKEKKENYKKDDNIVITTVARLTHEKGCLLIPDIAKLLIKKGYYICWLIVGNGTEYEEIKNKIVDLKIQENVFLLGEQVNPYPFIKQADIYVQPSYEEGYSTTICEAGILGKVIVGTTTSGGIREQIEDGKSGLIVEPKVITLAGAIEKVIVDKILKKNIENKIITKDFSNKLEIEKINKFIG